MLDVGEERVDELGLDVEAGAWAGSSMARRSSSRRIGADEHVVGAEQPREPG